MSRFSAAKLTTSLTATMGVSGLLTAGVSALGPALRESLVLSRVELSLFSLVVFVTASTTAIPWGLLSDRLKPLWGIFLVFALAILGMAGVVVSASLTGLLIAAVAGGCSLALSATVSNKLVSQFVTPQRRGRVLSTKQMGIQFAQVIAGLVFPAITVVLGWRLGFTAGILLAVVTLLVITVAGRRIFLPNDFTAHRLRTADHDPPNATSKTGLLVALMVYAFVTGICFQSNLFGLPLIGYEELGFDVATASKVVVLLGFVGFLSRLAWSRFADRPINIRLVMMLLAFGMLLGQSLLLVVHLASFEWSFWVGAVFIGAFFALVPVVVSGVALRYFPSERIGAISGVISVSTFGGFALGPLIFGAVTDAGSYLYSSWLLVAVVLVSILATILIPKKYLRTNQMPLEENLQLVRKEN